MEEERVAAKVLILLEGRRGRHDEVKRVEEGILAAMAFVARIRGAHDGVRWSCWCERETRGYE